MSKVVILVGIDCWGCSPDIPVSVVPRLCILQVCNRTSDI